MPRDVYIKPDHEPTNAELDAALAQSGRDDVLDFYPEGATRETMRQTLRTALKLDLYEKSAEGMVLVEINGKQGFIRPMSDIEWNFNKFHRFVERTFTACQLTLSKQTPQT